MIRLTMQSLTRRSTRAPMHPSRPASHFPHSPTSMRTRLLALTAFLALPLAAAPARAQSPTPEGTVITNTATATWTDANGNAYAPVTASASVTVGFAPGPDVSSAASATPASPSTGNTLDFTIGNGGNGDDSVTVATSAAAGLTITGYVHAGTPYATLALLNDALSTVAIAAGSSIVVTVVYDVAAAQGGQTLPLALTATSRRDPAASTASDASTTNIIPGATAAVGVTPDAGTVSRLPSNGVQYTATFTIENNGNGSDTYALSASVPGAVLAIVSVNGTAGTSGSVTVASGATTTIDVVYTVDDAAAAGATEAIGLTATSGIDGGVSDAGAITVTVIRAALTMTKEVFRDDQTTAITAAMRVTPGEFIQYRITVTNSGGGSATSVNISDPLPAQVAYVSSSADAAGWTIAESGGTVTGDLASLAPAASRYFWIRVQVR